MKTIDDIYQYFDDLVDQDDADQLFASSYLRGFITLCCANVDSSSQPLTKALATEVDSQLQAAKNELNPQDRALVQGFWHQLKLDYQA